MGNEWQTKIKSETEENSISCTKVEYKNHGERGDASIIGATLFCSVFFLMQKRCSVYSPN